MIDLDTLIAKPYRVQPHEVIALSVAVKAAQPILAWFEAEDDPRWDSPSMLDAFAAALAPFTAGNDTP